jgi:hypothetical protein
MRHPHKQKKAKKINKVPLPLTLEDRMKLSMSRWYTIYPTKYHLLNSWFLSSHDGEKAWKDGEFVFDDYPLFYYKKEIKRYLEEGLISELKSTLDVWKMNLISLKMREYDSGTSKVIVESTERRIKNSDVFIKETESNISKYGILRAAKIHRDTYKETNTDKAYVDTLKRLNGGVIPDNKLEYVGFPYFVYIPDSSPILHLPRDIKSEYIVELKDFINYVDNFGSKFSNPELFAKIKEDILSL